MMDVPFRPVTIFFMEEDLQWGEYVLKKFKADQLNLKIELLNLSSLSGENSPELEVAVRESHVIVLLTTSYLLTYLEKNSHWFSSMLKRRDPELSTVVVALVHVDPMDIKNVSDTCGYGYEEWETVQVDVQGRNIEEKVSQILGFVDRNSETKVRRGQSIRRDSDASMSVEVVPSSIRGPGEKVALLFSEKLTGDVTLCFRKMKEVVNTTQVNPYCVTFITPDTAEMSLQKITFQVNIDGVRHSRLKLTNLTTTSPSKPMPEFTSVEFMCQCYGVQTKEELDKKLAQTLSDSMCFGGCAMTLFDELRTTNAPTPRERLDSQYPTIVHWAAFNGLRELCSAIFSVPGAELACNIDNRDGHDPIDLARINGHQELSEFIFDFIETKEMANVCDLYVQSYSNASSLQVKTGGNLLYETMTYTPKMLSSVPTYTAFPFMDLPSTPRVPTEPGIPYDDAFLPKEPLMSPQEFLAASVTPELAPGAIGSRSQTELIDIQEEVKKGNFTIAEANMLFQAWKERYMTGNKALSFMDRRRGLQKLKEDHFKAMDALRAVTGKKKKSKQQDKDEEVCGLSISEPILQRNPFGLKSKSPFGSGRGSNSSSGSRSSHDSGRDSNTSHQSTSSGDLDVDKRNSSKDMYNDLISEVETVAPPPLPPRPKTTSNVDKSGKPQIMPRVFRKQSK